MLRLVGIGALGNMLSPSAGHLSGKNTPARFLRVLDRGKKSAHYHERRKNWLEHGATLVKTYSGLIKDCQIDVIIVCAGKNGDDVEIIKKLITQIKKKCKRKKPIILHLSTVSTEFVNAAFQVCSEFEIKYVNYPLTGGTSGAEAGTMLILASGDKDVYRLLEPTLNKIGQPRYLSERITAAAEVKLMGHLLVFYGLMGICSALSLRMACFDESLGQKRQVEFFDFLNTGSGGTRQWDVAVKLGVKEDRWDKGFLLQHAVIDIIYLTKLILQKELSILIMTPLLNLALTFAFLLHKYPNKTLTTQYFAKLLTDKEILAELKEFMSKYQCLEDAAIFLQNCILSLPDELQKKVELNIIPANFL